MLNFFARVLDLVAHFFAQAGIEIAERLVHQQHFRFDGEGAGQGDALLLAAAQERRGPVGEAAELDQLQRVQHALFDVGAGQLVRSIDQREGDIVVNRHMRPDGVGLEDHADAAPFGSDEEIAFGGTDQDIADGDLAAVGPLQTGDAAQERGLARAAEPEQDEELLVADIDADAVNGMHRIAAGLVDLQ